MSKETFLSFSNKTIPQLIPRLKLLREELKRHQTISAAMEYNAKKLEAAQSQLEKTNLKTALATKAASDAYEKLNAAKNKAQDIATNFQKHLQSELKLKKQMIAVNARLEAQNQRVLQQQAKMTLIARNKAHAEAKIGRIDAQLAAIPSNMPTSRTDAFGSKFTDKGAMIQNSINDQMRSSLNEKRQAALRLLRKIVLQEKRATRELSRKIDLQDQLNSEKSETKEHTAENARNVKESERSLEKQITLQDKLKAKHAKASEFADKAKAASGLAAKAFAKYMNISKWLGIFGVVKKISSVLLFVPTKLFKGLMWAFKKVGAWVGKVATNAISFYIGRVIWGIQNTIFSLIRTGFGLIPKSMNLAGARQKDLSFFNMMLGTPEAAEDMMRQVEGFAASTPLNLIQSRGAFGKIMQQLIGAGKDPQDTRGILQSFGDAVNGDTQRFNRVVYTMGTVIAKGFADNIDFKELANSLVNLKPILAKMRGTSIEGLKDSRITSDEMLQAFKILTGKGGMMFQAMKNQMTSWQGLISNLRDIYEFGLTAMGGPLAATVGSKIPLLTNSLKDAKGGFTDLGKGLSQVFLIAWRTAARVFGLKSSSLGDVLSSMGAWARRIALVIEDLISWARNGPSAFKNKFKTFFNFAMNMAGGILRPLFGIAGDFLSGVMEFAMRQVFGDLSILGVKANITPNEHESYSQKMDAKRIKVAKKLKKKQLALGPEGFGINPNSSYQALTQSNYLMNMLRMAQYGVEYGSNNPLNWSGKGAKEDGADYYRLEKMMNNAKRILKQQGVYEQTREIFNDKKGNYDIPKWYRGAGVNINQNNTIYTNDASRDIQQALITSARQVETAMGVV